jgi:hypothetical protein
MKYLELRTAWSAGCIAASLLILAMALRSYSFCDVYTTRPYRAPTSGVMSMEGQVYAFFQFQNLGKNWRLRTYPVGEVSLILDTFLSTKGAFRVPANSRFIIIITYWLLAAMVASLAIAPWLKWSTRFSIRSVVIDMTMIAVALAIAKTVVIQ